MTAEEKARNDFDIAQLQFRETAQKMSNALEKWAVGQGGYFDSEGNVCGLSAKDAGLFEFRNNQLSDLLQFQGAAEAYVKRLKVSLSDATQRLAFAKKGQSDDNYLHISDGQVLKNAQFYLDWRICRWWQTAYCRRAQQARPRAYLSRQYGQPQKGRHQGQI